MELNMNSDKSITSVDGHKLDIYIAEAKKDSKLGLVILQEIFGVNSHIRDVCDSFANIGLTSIAPALFDRSEPGLELNYETADIEKGRSLKTEIGWDDPLKDINSSINFLRERNFLKIGVIGYCWGGSLAFLAACRSNADAVVGYYGGQIIDFVDEKPSCPTMLHFGSKDSSIPLSDIKTISEKHPNVGVYVYEGAGHGFNCNKRADYDSNASKKALSRTIEHLKEHM
jgi:carboxymethylenebutenolidase